MVKEGLLVKFNSFTDIFLEELARQLAPNNSKLNYIIEITGNIPNLPIYNLSPKELIVLKEYLD